MIPKVNKLPHYYCVEQVREKVLSDMQDAETEINALYDILSKFPMPAKADIRTFQAKQIKAYIDTSMLDYLHTLSFLPEDTEKRIKGEFSNAWEAVKPDAERLEYMVCLFPDVPLIVEADAIKYDPHEAEIYAEKASGVKTTTEMREAYDIYSKLWQMLKEVYEWENTHNWRHSITEGMNDGYAYNSTFDLLSGSINYRGKRSEITDFDIHRFMTLYNIGRVGKGHN